VAQLVEELRYKQEGRVFDSRWGRWGSKAWVCGRSFPGIVGSNPAADINICLL
jgi:hypothetical protein